MLANDREYRTALKTEEIKDEIVRMSRLQAVQDQPIDRKIPQVHGHDHVRPTTDRRCKDVAITMIGQFEIRNETFMTGHDSLGKVLVRRRPGPFQLVGRQIGSIGKKIANPFIMDCGAPLRIV